MLVRHTTPLRRADPKGDDARWLRAVTERLAVPRHYLHQERSNRAIATFLARQLEGFGYRIRHQGPYRNVVALPPEPGPYTLVCAHYDSVATTPGADDNASALAVLLGAARARPKGVAFVAFNREEEGMIGSADFVGWLTSPEAPVITDVHVLEMVGYTDYTPGSQRIPPPLPKFLMPRDTADFLAVVGIGPAWSLAGKVRRAAEGHLGIPPVVTLQAPALATHLAPDLCRSDHYPFIIQGRPAVMWTDTADFRSHHYHRPSDTPDTLDYGFMAGVLRLLLLTLGEPGEPGEPVPRAA